MHIEFLVEERSAEEALGILIPKMIGDHVSWRIHSHQGKPDLLKKLTARMQAYGKWIPEDWSVVVLVDEDRQDCKEIKGELEAAAARAGFVTKSASGKGGRFQVANRIAIEELEAWFFGDLPALRKAYPRISPNLGQKSKFRDPDAIPGGTWEALERVLQAKGYHMGGLKKIQAAREIAIHMDPARNRSRSFQCFREALALLARA